MGETDKYRHIFFSHIWVEMKKNCCIQIINRYIYIYHIPYIARIYRLFVTILISPGNKIETAAP